MPTFDGTTGRVYFKAWRVLPPPTATVLYLHRFGEHSGLYHRLGNTLNASGIDLWALDEIGHGLTEGERAVIRSIDDLAENGRRLSALAEAAEPGAPVFLAGHSLGSVATAVSALRDPGRYQGLIPSGAPLSPLDWVLALGQDDAAELALDAADLSSDRFYLDELENDPLAFTIAAGARSLVTVLPLPGRNSRAVSGRCRSPCCSCAAERIRSCRSLMPGTGRPACPGDAWRSSPAPATTCSTRPCIARWRRRSPSGPIALEVPDAARGHLCPGTRRGHRALRHGGLLDPTAQHLRRNGP